MSLEVLYQWMQEVEQRLSNLKKWQAVGVALFSFGVVQVRPEGQVHLIYGAYAASQGGPAGKLSAAVERAIQLQVTF